MSTIYLVNDDNSVGPVALVPTIAEARERVRQMSEDGEGAGSIEKIEVQMTRKGICDLIHRRFGVAIFENYLP